jgi:HEAT repeat protein
MVEPAYTYDSKAGVFLTEACVSRLIPNYGNEGRHLPVPLYEQLRKGGRSSILKAFKDKDPLVVREAIYAWTERWSQYQRTEDFRDVMRFLTDARPEIRAYAAWSCGTIVLKDALPMLLKDLSDSDPKVRREAALALRPGIAVNHEQTTREALTKSSNDPDPGVRWAAKWNLERFNR